MGQMIDRGALRVKYAKMDKAKHVPDVLTSSHSYLDYLCMLKRESLNSREKNGQIKTR